MDELNNGSTPEVEPEGERNELSEDKSAKAYRELQSLLDKRTSDLEKQLQKEREERIRLEERSRLTSEQRETAPQKPQIPSRPKNYNKIDASADPDSPSAQYDIQMQEYLIAKSVYDDYVISKFEEERNTRLQQEQRAKQERDLIAGFTQYASPDEATKAADWFKKTVNDGDFEGVIKAYRALNNQPVKEKQTMDSIPLPAGVVPNQTGKTEKTKAQSLREFIGSHRI